MSAIRLLPASVADAIAAGEVVERPASVVKELCENAVDAGATRLDVVVDGGGTSRIRVVDDGSGIPSSELALAVARHATSKIARVDDLASISTLGFRGEALASIAAVAEVVVTSRTAAGDGARLRVRASEVLEAGPAASAPGTSVEVRDLFFATPARLRFLRSARTETAAATRVVADLALTHPRVAVTCTVDGRVSMRSPGGTLRDSLRAVFGSAAAELIDVAAPGDIAVHGAISEPRAHRGTRGQVVLVVNGRRVHNRALGVAVEEAYRGLLPGGRWPFGVVAVDIDPSSVDVNVHPGKREVRFREEGRVFASVQRACWDALQGSRPYATGGGAGLALRDALGWSSSGTRAMAPAGTVSSGGGGSTGWRPLLRRGELQASAPGSQPAAGGVTGVQTAPDAGPTAIDRPGAGGLAGLAPLRALGQAGSAWLVAESPVGVVLVDPHAAHEKVLYADLLAGWQQGRASASPAASQLLLLPVAVGVDSGAVAQLEEHADLVARLGFAVEPFGPACVRCSAIPAACSAGDPERLVRDLAETLGTAGTTSEREHRLAALLACHSAVRLGDAMAPPQQQRLLDELTRTPGGLTCPHGRPTVVVLDDATLRRAFRRPAPG